MNSTRNYIPDSWSLIEEYDGNYIFENTSKSFCVNIDYVYACEYPYSITFIQLQGDTVIIGFEDGAYSTHSKNLQEATTKAYKMMEFINSKVHHIG